MTMCGELDMVRPIVDEHTAANQRIEPGRWRR
jgi:hypothetical protein